MENSGRKLRSALRLIYYAALYCIAMIAMFHLGPVRNILAVVPLLPSWLQIRRKRPIIHEGLQAEMLYSLILLGLFGLLDALVILYYELTGGLGWCAMPPAVGFVIVLPLWILIRRKRRLAQAGMRGEMLYSLILLGLFWLLNVSVGIWEICYDLIDRW